MNKRRISTALFAAVLCTTVVIPQVRADEWDKKTIVKISEPIEVSGVRLEPGTYVFKLANLSAERHLVTITNEAQSHTYATVMAIPNYRLEPKDKSTFLFWETPAGQPRALRAWFYPADNYGQEFPAPKIQNQIAVVPRPEPAPVVAQNTPPPPPAPEVAPPPPPPAAEPEPPPQVAKNEPPLVLPQTSSNLPLMALSGFLAIGIAIGLGSLVKRVG